MNKRGSISEKIILVILSVLMILLLVMSLSYSIYIGSPTTSSPQAPTLGAKVISLEELNYKFKGYNFNQADANSINNNLVPKYINAEGTLDRTALYSAINAQYSFKRFWAQTKSLFSSAGGIVTGALAAIGFTNPRNWLDPFYIWPIFFAAILYTIIRRTYYAIKVNLKNPKTVSWSLWARGIYKYYGIKRIVYTFWILFIVYTICWAVPIVKPIMAPLFSDYKLSVTASYEALVKTAQGASVQATSEISGLNSFYLLMIRSFATALYAFFFFLVKEIVKSFTEKTAKGREQILEDIEEEKRQMREEQSKAAVKVLRNIGKYMEEPAKPE